MAARITRAQDAPGYAPPLHDGVTARRLQGLEAGPTDAFWVGRSTYPPGSAAQLAPTPAETVYVCLSGRLTLTTEDGAGGDRVDELGPGDSVHLPAGTVRSVTNRATDDAELLVIMSLGGTR